MRGVPARCTRHSLGDRCTWREGLGLATAGGRGSGDVRREPQAAGHRGAVRGSRGGRRAYVRRTRAKLPPRNGETPGEPGRLRRVTLAALPLDCSRPPSLFTSRPSGPARRRRALEAVEKFVTTRPMALCGPMALLRAPDPLASGCE
jgi:hypothetical protein